MKTSETTKEIYPAIIGLQSEMETIARDKTVSQGKFSFKYAPLDSIMEKIKPLFAARGLAVVQAVDKESLTTRLSTHRENGLSQKHTLTAITRICRGLVGK